MGKPDEQDENYVKILFRLERDADGYPPNDWESVWAKVAGSGRYEIDNVPFYVRGVSWKDIVEAEERDEEYFFKRVVRPSGHSVLRIIVFKKDEVPALRERLIELGCSSEASHIEGFLAVDVPPNVPLGRVRQYLDTGEQREWWEYEEASLRQD